MTNPRDIDALLFDFGGVLVQIDFQRVCRHWADAAGVPVKEVAGRFALGPTYERHERGEIAIGDYCHALRRDLGIALDDERLVEGWQQVFVDSIAPTAALLRELRGRIPMYLFSNTNLTHYDFFRRRYARELEPLDRIFTSHEMGLRKPEREAFLHVAREIGSDPRRILFFDDTLANVEAARALGMPAVHVRSPEDVRVAVEPWLRVDAAGTGA